MEGGIEEWEKWGEMVFTKTENRASTRALEGTKALADTATMRANETCHKVTAPNGKKLGASSSKVPGGCKGASARFPKPYFLDLKCDAMHQRCTPMHIR